MPSPPGQGLRRFGRFGWKGRLLLSRHNPMMRRKCQP
jgi:hypothetical protein